jgi:hypothetical protein
MDLAQQTFSGGQTMSRIWRAAVTALAGVAAFSLVACSGGTAGATGTPLTSAAPPASAAPASAEPSGSASAAPSSALNQATLAFQEVGGSKITGGAILTDLGGEQTAVTIGVVAAGVTDPMPANIVPGTCADMGGGAGASASPGASAESSPAASAAAEPSAGASPAASDSGAVPLNPTANTQLSDLTAGSSNTVVGASLDTLLATPYAIEILKSAKDSAVVACADIAR